MKINFTRLLAGMLALLTLSTNGQSILPSTSTAYCPGSTVSFTVTLPTGAYYGAQAYGWPIVGVSGCQAASINSGTASLNHNVLTFTGSFIDWDGPQGIQVTCYDASDTLRTFDFHYDRIESFNTPDVASEPVPSPATVTAPRCQTAAFNISFPKVVYADPWTATKLTYGTVTTYEYLLPVGWSIGSSVSDGSTWIPGSSAVTVNADAADGIGGSVQVRAIGCNPAMTRGPIAQIPISRPAPTLSLASSDGSNTVCTSKSFTLSGVPSGATVSWSSSDNTIATVSGNTTSATVTRTGSSNGTADITATVTDCITSYPVLATVITGTPASYVTRTTYGGGYTFVDYALLIPGVSYNWYLDGVLQSSHGSSTSGFIDCSTSVKMDLETVTTCGTSPLVRSGLFIKCCTGCEQSVTRDTVNGRVPGITDTGKSVSHSGFVIAPNPSAGIIKIRAGAIQAGMIYQVRVIDVMGKIRKTFQYSSGVRDIDVDLSSLGNGIYTVQVYDKMHWSSYQVSILK